MKWKVVYLINGAEMYPVERIFELDTHDEETVRHYVQRLIPEAEIKSVTLVLIDDKIKPKRYWLTLIPFIGIWYVFKFIDGDSQRNYEFCNSFYNLGSALIQGIYFIILSFICFS